MELRAGFERRERASSARLRGVESVECFIVAIALLLDQLQKERQLMNKDEDEDQYREGTWMLLYRPSALEGSHEIDKTEDRHISSLLFFSSSPLPFILQGKVQSWFVTINIGGC